MKARHVCAVLGVALAVGTVVFMRSLVASNDRQSVAMAGRLLKAVPVPGGSSVAHMTLDFRPDGRVMQGPPMMASVATKPGVKGAVVTKALFAQRRLKAPPVGSELTFVGRRGAYRVTLSEVLDWDRPVRGYPNVFVSPETAEEIGEEWRTWEPKDADELSPLFRSDAGRNMDRARPLLLWAAVLTALCLLINSLILSVEARRREIAVLRVVGATRSRVAGLVAAESAALAFAGLVVGVAGGVAAVAAYVGIDGETFPMGMAVDSVGILAAAVATPVISVVASLAAMKPALSVRPLEAASARLPRRRPLGMVVAFACGFGAFVAVEVWGASLTKPFVPSPEWPDAIVSILPGGVSAFDIERLQNLPGVRKIAELQPLQACIVEEGERKKEEGKGNREEGTGKRKEGGFLRGGSQCRNALLLASDWLPDFRFEQGDRAEAEKAMREGDACIISSMMARAHGLSLGGDLPLDCGGGLVVRLKVVGVVDLNWHMVTSRGLLRGLNRMPVNTDGPVFVSFDTLQACDARPAEFVRMTHLWLDYEPAFLAEHGVFGAGRLVEREIVDALDGAYGEDDEGVVRGNTVRLHSRDEVADGTLAHGAELVGAMARVPFVFLAVLSLGFVAVLVASVDSRRREFAVLSAVGATRMQLAGVLVAEALRIAAVGIVFGVAGGSAVGWLCTAGTRAAMANWGLPACFAMPVCTIALGAAGAVLFALAVSVPTALALVRRRSLPQS